MADPKITTIYGIGDDGVEYTTQLNWVPRTPPAPPVVVPPIVIPPVVTPPAAAVVMPKVNYHYPWAVAGVTLVPPGGNIGAALAKGPVRLGVGSYSGTVNWQSNFHLYGMPGTDCSGVTFNFSDGDTGGILSGIFGGVANINGHVMGNVFRRLKWLDINVQQGATFESNLIYGFNGGLNCFGGWLVNDRIIGNTKHGQADTSKPAVTIQSPNDGKSDGTVFLWSTDQTLDIGYKISGQRRITFAGKDVEGPKIQVMDVDTTGVIAAFCLNGGNNGPVAYGFGAACDELQLIGGGFSGGINPVVKSNGLKRFFTAGINASNSGQIDATYTEASSAAALAPILAPTRTGSPWERPSLPMPANPTIIIGADATAAVQAAVNGNSLLPAGTYTMSAPVTMTPAHNVLIGAGDGQTIISCMDKTKDAFRWAGNGNGAVSFHLSDMTIIGARYGVYANTAGDQLNECTLSHITFRSCTAGICAQSIYGVDNNFFDTLNFVNCGTGILQLPDPAYTTGETPTMTYVDKTVFYGCQFINCGEAANMQAKRANNLDAFIGCIFNGCGRIGVFTGNNALMFAQCDMIACGSLQSQIVYLTGCNFSGGGPYLTGDVIGEGLSFKGTGPAFTNPGKVILLNSRPGRMTLAGTLLNCNDSAVPQLLFGSVMA